MSAKLSHWMFVMVWKCVCTFVCCVCVAFDLILIHLIWSANSIDSLICEHLIKSNVHRDSFRREDTHIHRDTLSNIQRTMARNWCDTIYNWDASAHFNAWKRQTPFTEALDDHMFSVHIFVVFFFFHFSCVQMEFNRHILMCDTISYHIRKNFASHQFHLYLTK